MSTEAQKNELLEQFQNYLEQNNPETFTSNDQPDLNTLLSEMAGLKTEVKTESRQFKNTLDSLSSALTTVQEDNKKISKQQDEIMRTMLLEMVDIYDRLSTGMNVLQHYKPVATVFKKSRKKDIRFIKRFKEGQDMTVRRFEQMLLKYQVRTIDCIGKMLDPVTMNAVEIAQDPKFENGIVIEELRKGFLFQDQILRLAEVKVNKTNSR